MSDERELLLELALCDAKCQWAGREENCKEERKPPKLSDCEAIELFAGGKFVGLPKKEQSEKLRDFLTTYEVARNFSKEQKNNLIKPLLDLREKGIRAQVNHLIHTPLLVEELVCAFQVGQSNLSRRITAASKLAMFMYPTDRIFIYDGVAGRAIRKRRGENTTGNYSKFWNLCKKELEKEMKKEDFTNAVTDFKAFVKKFTPYIPRQDLDRADFFERRLFDKLLWREGQQV